MSWLSEILDIFRRKPRPTPPPVPPTPPVPPSPPVPPAPPSPTGTVQERLLALHNAQRARAGLNPLTLNAMLTVSAQREADCCAFANRLDHNCGGTTPWQRIEEAGYAWSAAAENIAQGQRSPEEAVNDWMNSAGHRRNILGDYAEVGFGVSGDMWAADFGTPANHRSVGRVPFCAAGGVVRDATGRVYLLHR